MGKARGFLEIAREENRKRPVPERITDWREFELLVPEAELRAILFPLLDGLLATDPATGRIPLPATPTNDDWGLALELA